MLIEQSEGRKVANLTESGRAYVEQNRAELEAAWNAATNEVDDRAVAIRELDVDSVPLNFLQPIAGTALAAQEPMSPLTALQTIAMFRLVLPDKPIRIAGGRTTCLRDLQSWIFYAGASGCMTGNYLTTAGREPQQDRQMLIDLELEIEQEE